tara:strand:- start:299 stop:748 length:450 start_codon:yes stop_codon:yes gene_type:complete
MTSIKQLIFFISTKYNNTEVSLLLLRIVFGLIMLINHGISKITSDKIRWEKLGSALTDLIGLDFLNTFFGFMASLSESIGALLIVFGLFTRYASLLLFITMLVASLHHIHDNQFPELAILYGVFFLALIFSGPGKYSLDHLYYLKSKMR